MRDTGMNPSLVSGLLVNHRSVRAQSTRKVSNRPVVTIGKDTPPNLLLGQKCNGKGWLDLWRCSIIPSNNEK